MKRNARRTALLALTLAGLGLGLAGCVYYPGYGYGPGYYAPPGHHGWHHYRHDNDDY